MKVILRGLKKKQGLPRHTEKFLEVRYYNIYQTESHQIPINFM